MSTTVEYPSEIVPRPPRLTMDLPEDWQQVWAPETLIAVRKADDGSGRFLPNVAVTHRVVPAPYDGDRAYADLQAFVAGKDEGEVRPLRTKTIDGQEWVGTDVAFVEPEAGTVAQIHLFLLRQRGEVVDLLQVVGSFGAAELEQDQAVIGQALESVRVTW